MKLTNEQKKTAIKRVLIAGAIFTVGAILKKTYDCGYGKGMDSIFSMPEDHRMVYDMSDGEQFLVVRLGDYWTDIQNVFEHSERRLRNETN